ncbi:uncharacterized protein LOC103576302 [Microplitis demolitor]|uniref:uncharacterized protein LOC103576302 n=1 Tax=Microplitis demolitor TaxID=69319 RepID=UPI00235B6C34|nr:uncharacterized protein LOC103576302 [Microplitis demolitor]
MLEKKCSLFVNSVAIFIFGPDNLVTSTITGNHSRRKPSDGDRPKKLDQRSLLEMRDFYKYYLDKSPYMTIFELLERDDEFKKLYTYLSRFIASVKKASDPEAVKEKKVEKININDKENNEAESQVTIPRSINEIENENNGVNNDPDSESGNEEFENAAGDRYYNSSAHDDSEDDAEDKTENSLYIDETINL